MARNEPHKSVDHSLLEDAQAFVLGTALCALGVHLLTHIGLVTGQTAGAAVLLSYASEQSFGFWFFIVNLPFYVLGYIRLGARFVVKSFVAVALLSVMTWYVPGLLPLGDIQPWVGALYAGAATGLGLMILFRHGASLGGIGVLALVIQERTGFRAGWVQLGFDAVLFAAAMTFMDPFLVAVSLLGAVVLNLIIAVNHRQDRYVAR